MIKITRPDGKVFEIDDADQERIKQLVVEHKGDLMKAIEAHFVEKFHEPYWRGDFSRAEEAMTEGYKRQPPFDPKNPPEAPATAAFSVLDVNAKGAPTIEDFQRWMLDEVERKVVRVAMGLLFNPATSTVYRGLLTSEEWVVAKRLYAEMKEGDQEEAARRVRRKFRPGPAERAEEKSDE